MSMCILKNGNIPVSEQKTSNMLNNYLLFIRGLSTTIISG